MRVRKPVFQLIAILLLSTMACNLGQVSATAVLLPGPNNVIRAKPAGVVATLRSSPTKPSPTDTMTPLPTATLVLTKTFTPSPTATTAPSPTRTPTMACTEKQGEVWDETIDSAVSQIAVAQPTVDYRVYLPPCYQVSQRRYPYVFLFHGVGSDDTQWTDELDVNGVLDAGIADGSLPPMILIMPTGGLMAYDNYFVAGQSYESFIIDELLPEIDKRYCTWGDTAGRAIGGISRGGFWAYEIGFRHPTLFSAIGGHSPYFDPDNAPPDYNPLNLAKSVNFPPGTQPRLWLDTGPNDSVHPQIDIFAQSLANRNIDPGYTLYPTGTHDSAYWASHMAAYLTFYGLHWPRQVDDLPPCQHTGS